MFSKLSLSSFVGSFSVGTVARFMLVLVYGTRSYQTTIVGASITGGRLILTTRRLLVIRQIRGFTNSSMVVGRVVRFFDGLQPVSKRATLIGATLSLFFSTRFYFRSSRVVLLSNEVFTGIDKVTFGP